MGSLTTSDNLVWLLITLGLILPPILFIIVRNTVKIHRQGIVMDLSKVFNAPATGDARSGEDFIPSFEFVKYKYFLGGTGQKGESNQEDFAWWAWSAGLLALMVVFIVFGFIASRYVNFSLLTFLIGSECASKNIGQCADPLLSAWVCGLLAALAGGYVFMIRNFFRAINNFDFGPASYVSATNNLIAGALLITIFVFSFDFMTHAARSSAFFAGVLITLGYAVGHFPESANRMVMDRSKLAHFKRDNPDIYRKITATPVDIIDGIDSDIRDRLADHHIRSTQNLATANPLMLFVETPYGVYQIMDWVAQAQLCCSVGPDKLIRLWQLGIRTLFDLERAALNETWRNKDLLLAIGAILLPDRRSISDGSGRSGITEELVIATIQVKLDDPHVHRLRQIYIKVGERLGDTNRRFSGLPKTAPNATS